VGLSGGQFGLNVCRERRPMETLELSCWSPTGTRFAVPDRFGLAGLGQSWITAFTVPPAKIGTNTFSVTLTNDSDKRWFVGADLLRGEGRDAEARALSAGRSRANRLLPGEHNTFSYDYALGDAEPRELTYRIYDADDADAGYLAERTFIPRVMEPLSMDLCPRTTYLSEQMAAAEFEINLAEDVSPAAQLLLELGDEDGRVVRRGTVGPIEGNRLSAMVNLRGLDAGQYTLAATLRTVGDDGRPRGISLSDNPAIECGPELARVSTPLMRIRGPFD